MRKILNLEYQILTIRKSLFKKSIQFKSISMISYKQNILKKFFEQKKQILQGYNSLYKINNDQIQKLK